MVPFLTTLVRVGREVFPSQQGSRPRLDKVILASWARAFQPLRFNGNHPPTLMLD